MEDRSHNPFVNVNKSIIENNNNNNNNNIQNVENSNPNPFNLPVQRETQVSFFSFFIVKGIYIYLFIYFKNNNKII